LFTVWAVNKAFFFLRKIFEKFFEKVQKIALLAGYQLRGQDKRLSSSMIFENNEYPFIKHFTHVIFTRSE